MDTRPTKKRLSMACNSCRMRKVKCDADYPQCRNCRLRNEVCATSDPRRPGEPVIREWIVTEKTTKNDTNKSAVYASPAPSLQHQLFHQRQVPETYAEQLVATNNANGQNANGHPLSSKTEEPAQTDFHESPVHQPFHVSSNTDPELNRTKILGGSSSQCLAKSLDVYLKSVNQKPISGLFKYGMRFSEEVDIALEVSLPALPDDSVLREYMASFWDRIHPLYPIFEAESFHDSVKCFTELKDQLKSISRDQIPGLASVYIAISLGADEQARRVTPDGTKYLQAAASLLGHLTLVPYVPSVQALLMFTIAYRGRNQEGVGWQALGMAIRIAHTIGMHRRAAYSAPRSGNVQQIQKYKHEARIWAVCCIIEKCMELESGRPTAIPYSFTCDDILPPQLHRSDDEQLLRWQLGLAVFQNQISQHIYGHTLRKRRARDILLDTACLDKCLLDWVNGIPAQMRPGNDIFCSREAFHLAAWLSMMYHQAMITLHRAALIANNAGFESEVEKHGPDDSSRFRLFGGESICVNSARAIAKLDIELSDQKTDTRMIPAGVPLLACIVLATYLIKNPGSRMQSTDLELLKTCLELCSEKWIDCGQDARFVKGLSTLYERVSEYVGSQKSNKVSNTPKPPTFNGNVLTNEPSNHTENRTSFLPRDTHQLDNAEKQFSTASDLPRMPQPAKRPYQADDQIATNPTIQHFYSEAPPEIGNQQLHYDNSEQHTNVQQDEISTDINRYNWPQQPGQVDVHFPFDGYNVEDLWEWMMYFDSSSEVISNPRT